MKRYRQTLAVLALGAAAALLLFLMLRTPTEERPVLEPTTEVGPVPAPPSPGDLLRMEEDSTGPSSGAQTADGAGRSDRVAGALRGRVLDERDRPIRDAAVHVTAVHPALLRGAPYPDGAVLAQTRTDGDGHFELPAPSGSWLRLTASAPGHGTVGRLVASTGATVTLRLPAAGTLVVDVRDESDRPVVDAALTVHVDQTVVRARSGADGQATLEALPPGDAQVTTALDGFAVIRTGPYTIGAGAVVRATVLLPAAILVEGVIRAEADGAPVPDARVYVARPGRASAGTPTGPDGRFGPLEGGGAGERVFVSVHAPGFAPVLEPVVLHGPRSQSVEIRLVGAQDWRGQVLLPGGRPAAGAHVAYTPDGVAGRAPATTQADADGRFVLPPPPPPTPGRRVVLVARHGGLEAALALRPGMARPEPLRLVLAGGPDVTGRVVDARGRPVPGVQVRLAPAWRRLDDRTTPGAATSRLLLANEAGFLGLSAATAGDGTWRIPSVPPGPYRVRFGFRGAEATRGEVLEVGAGPASAGTWTIDAGVALRGRVLNARGGPAAGAAVRVAATDGSGTSRRTTTDADGSYAFRGLEEGVYRLSARLGARRPATVQVRLDGDREDVDVSLDEDAVIAGRVLLPEGGRPYSGLLTIHLRPATGAPRSPHSLRVRDGTFRWEGVPTGTWHLEARAPGGRIGRTATPIEVDSGRVSNATLTLADRGVLEGTVRTASGEPVASARLALTSEGTSGRRLATADARGGFRFEGLAPGTYALEAWGRGGARVEERVTVASGAANRRDVSLAVAGSARVAVIDEQGRPVAGAVVLFRTEAGTVPVARPDRTARDGTVVREDLPLGAVEVRVRTADGRRGFGQVVIDAKRTADVRVRVTTAER